MLSKHQVRFILRCLDAAHALTTQADPGECEGPLAWNIRQAREMLLDVAVAPVALAHFSPLEGRA